jgi:hypothetical protein
MFLADLNTIGEVMQRDHDFIIRNRSHPFFEDQFVEGREYGIERRFLRI